MLENAKVILNSEALRSVLCLILTGVVIMICKIAAAWLAAHKDGAAAANAAAAATAAKETAELRDRLIARGLQLVEQAVVYINQTFVDAKRKDGSFDKAAARLAYIRAEANIQRFISDEIKAAISEEYKDFDEWLKLSIEAAVNAHKTDYLTNAPLSAEIVLNTPEAVLTEGGADNEQDN